MKTLNREHHAVQNVGLKDRLIRLVIGAALIAVVIIDFVQGMSLGWHAYLPIVAIYPLITGMLGYDPIYSMMHTRSCDTSDSNRCGTFPFEFRNAFGKKYECGDNDDCSVTGGHR